MPALPTSSPPTLLHRAGRRLARWLLPPDAAARPAPPLWADRVDDGPEPLPPGSRRAQRH